MRSSKGRPMLTSSGPRCVIGEAPSEKIVTEAELHVKKLLELQMDSAVTLPSLQARFKEFSAGVRYEPSLASVSGTKSLTSYASIVDEDQKLESLRQYGLAEDDVKFKLQCDSVQEGRRHLINPEVAQERIERINQQVEVKHRSLQREVAFSGAAPVARHTLELERAIGHGERLTKMASCLLRERCDDASNYARDGTCEEEAADHPAAMLCEIARKLSAGSQRKRSKVASGHSTCKRRQSDFGHDCAQTCYSEQSLGNPPACPVAVSSCQAEGPAVTTRLTASASSESSGSPQGLSYSAACGTTWSCIEGTGVVPHGPADAASHDKGLSEKSCVSSAVPVCGPVRLVTDEEIARNKISIEELKAMPRFANYAPGEPSNVLYLKNMASCVVELDLVALFQRFSTPTKARVMYRLLVGRMRGQGFVTFPDKETAASALQAVNGFVLRGKPLVISYGKSYPHTASNSSDVVCSSAAEDRVLT